MFLKYEKQNKLRSFICTSCFKLRSDTSKIETVNKENIYWVIIIQIHLTWTKLSIYYRHRFSEYSISHI